MGLVIVFLVLMAAKIIGCIIISAIMRKKNIRRLYRFFTGSAFAFVIAATFLAAVFPPSEEISPTGGYAVASEDYWIDEGSPDLYSDGIREVWVRKWHPVGCDETHPVIVASHGSCGTIDNNITLYKEMASHGYTVLAVCHSGQAAKMIYRNGTSSGPSSRFLRQMSADAQNDPDGSYEIFREWMSVRISDLDTVMDDFSAGRDIDFIVMGHSLGGSAAYAMARRRSDVVGCIALESPFMYDITGTEKGDYIFNENDYTVPLLNIYSDQSYSHLHEWKQYRNNAIFLDSENTLYTNIYYKGTGHMGLCDLSIASPLLAAALSGGFPDNDARIQLERLNSDCLEWLDSIG